MDSLTLIAPAGLAFAAAGGVIVLNRLGVRIARIWSLAALALILVWVLTGSLAARVPLAAEFGADAGVDPAPWLVLDSVSWPLAFMLTAVLLAALLTALIDLDHVDVGLLTAWSLFAGIGLLTIFSTGFQMLLAGWVLVDAITLWMRLRDSPAPQVRRRAVHSFGLQQFGLLAVFAAAAAGGIMQDVTAPFPPEAAPLIYFGLFCRMLLAPLQAGGAGEEGGDLRRIATPGLVQMTVSGLILVRAAEVGLEGFWRLPALAAAALIGLYSAASWVGGGSVLGGRHFWMSAMGALGLAASMMGRPAAAASLVFGLVSGGAFMFNRAQKGGGSAWLVFAAVVLLSGLPFTPLWAAAGWIEGEFWSYGWLWGMVLALVLIGCVKFGLVVQRHVPRVSPGVNAAYLTGLLLALISLVVANWPFLGADPAVGRAWWGGGLVLLLAAGWYSVAQATGGAGLAWLETVRLERLVAWPIRRVGSVVRLGGRAAAYMARLFEGEGSLLWALVLLGLIATIFSQIGLGQ